MTNLRVFYTTVFFMKEITPSLHSEVTQIKVTITKGSKKRLVKEWKIDKLLGINWIKLNWTGTSREVNEVNWRDTQFTWVGLNGTWTGTEGTLTWYKLPCDVNCLTLGYLWINWKWLDGKNPKVNWFQGQLVIGTPRQSAKFLIWRRFSAIDTVIFLPPSSSGQYVSSRQKSNGKKIKFSSINTVLLDFSREEGKKTKKTIWIFHES